MTSLNVLVIAYYFPPMGLSGVQRISKFIKYLPEFGWCPIVLTSNSPIYYAFDDSLLNELEAKNIKIYRTDEDLSKIKKEKGNRKINYPSKFRQKIQSRLLQTVLQPDSRRIWAKYAIQKAEQIFSENQIDAILATAPPFTDFLIANKLSKQYDIPYILDYRDLWVDNPYYFYATPFHKNYAITLEEKILLNASRTIVITRDMKNRMINRYRFLNHNDISIIPHGFDKEDFILAQNNAKKSKKFVVTHSGVFSADLTPKYFFKAVNALINEKPEIKNDLEIRLIGILQKNYLKQIEKLGLSDIIKTTGYIEHIEAVQNLIEADVLWFMVPNSIVTPSRFYEYLGAKKPMIISSPVSDLTKIAESTNGAIITNFNDADAIKSSILNLYNKWKVNQLPKVDEKSIEKFERKLLTQQLAKELAYSVKFR